MKTSSIKFSRISSSGSRVETYGQTGRLSDTISHICVHFMHCVQRMHNNAYETPAQALEPTETFSTTSIYMGNA
jgi:hypothetical protein